MSKKKKKMQGLPIFFMFGEMKWCPSYSVYQLFQWSYLELTTLFCLKFMPKIYMMKLLVVKEIDILNFKYSLEVVENI